jgi:2-hydroxychromene-2-carboxylate isomerase
MGSVVSLDAVRRLRVRDRRAAGDRVRSTFFFDLADPGTYLAAERIDHVFPGVAWVPTSHGALRAGLGAPAVEAPAERAAIADRAAALSMPLVWPETHPAPRPMVMRAAAHACMNDRGGAFVLAASRLAFCGGFDLDDPEVLAEAAAAAGLPLQDVLQAVGDPRHDAEIEASAMRLLAAGATRLPAIRVGRVLFCGEERLAEAAALRRDPAPERRRAQ